MRQTIHIPHQDLLLWIDGELSAHRAGEIRQHVNACWTCRTRVAELEQTIGEFVQLHRREFEGKIPSSEGPRALLKARLAEQTEAAVSRRSPARMVQFRIAATVAMGILLSGIAFWRYQRAGIDEAFYRTIPNQSLTPGAIDPVNKYDVCNGNVPVNDPAVPDPLRRQVLQAYGLTNVSNKEYEIDYLVTPKLGGAINIRNLWPEPSTHTVWTAHVKDVLEDHLNYLVCSGQLDLETAQHEVSSDWVGSLQEVLSNECAYTRTCRAAQNERNTNSACGQQTVFSESDHSSRSAINGSTLAALRAGM